MSKVNNARHLVFINRFWRWCSWGKYAGKRDERLRKRQVENCSKFRWHLPYLKLLANDQEEFVYSELSHYHTNASVSNWVHQLLLIICHFLSCHPDTSPPSLLPPFDFIFIFFVSLGIVCEPGSGSRTTNDTRRDLSIKHPNTVVPSIDRQGGIGIGIGISTKKKKRPTCDAVMQRF